MAGGSAVDVATHDLVIHDGMIAPMRCGIMDDPEEAVPGKSSVEETDCLSDRSGAWVR
jgi:hypothetical protein